MRRRLLAPRVSFPLRWFRLVPGRNHPVPLLPAWCLRHHRSPQPVEVRHRHDYFASTFAAAQTAIIWALVFTFVSGDIRDSTRCRSPSCSSRQHPDQLFGVGALAHRGLLPFRGFVRESHWLSSHCTFLPVRAVQVTATPLLAGPSSCQM